MKLRILILTFLVSFISCKPDSNHQGSKTNLNISNKVENNHTITDQKQIKNDTIERFFPLEKETIKKDTLIENSNIKIVIIQNSLDTYVTDEFDSDGTKHIHKYRDFQYHLKITEENVVIVDTLLQKENFAKHTDQQLLDIGNFHGYWFNRIKDKQIELFGVISKPEGDDYSFAFHHFFDMNTRAFVIKASVDEDI